jgi:hypothetical protein
MAGLMAMTSNLALAGSVFVNTTDGGTGAYARNIAAVDGTTAGDDDIEFFVDFKFPTAAGENVHAEYRLENSIMLRLANEQGAGTLAIDANSTGIDFIIRVSDNGQFFAVRIRERVLVNSTGNATTGVTNTTFAFDHNWHRLGITVAGAQATMTIDGQVVLAATVNDTPAPDGEFFSISPRIGGGSAVPTTDVFVRWDNVTVNGTVVDDFESYNAGDPLLANGLPWINGTALTNGSDPASWAIDAEDSDYGAVPPPPPPYDFNLQPDEDTELCNDTNGGGPTANRNGAGSIAIRNTDAGGGRRRVAMISYRNIDTTIGHKVEDAYLTITALDSSGNNRPMTVYGVIEALDDVTETSLTWNNAPGVKNDPAPAIDSILDANAYDFADLTEPLTSYIGTPNGMITSTSLTQAFDDFINSDTDGIVTFLIRPAFDDDGGLIGRHETFNGPALRGNFAAPIEVGMVVEDTANLAGYGFDAALFDFLTTGGLGYNVELVNGDDFDTAVADAWETSKALVVISESAGSADSVEWAGRAVPTLTCEQFGWDDIDFASASGVWVFNETEINVTNSTHQIMTGAGLSAGLVTVHTTPTQVAVILGANLTNGANALATLPPGNVDLDETGSTTGEGSDYVAVWAVELGDPIESGPAPARAVGLFVEGANTAPRTADELTTDGYNLLGSAIDWLLGDPTPNKVEQDRWMLY